MAESPAVTGTSVYLGRIGSLSFGSSSIEGSIRSHISASSAVDLIIDIQFCHELAPVSISDDGTAWEFILSSRVLLNRRIDVNDEALLKMLQRLSRQAS